MQQDTIELRNVTKAWFCGLWVLAFGMAPCVAAGTEIRLVADLEPTAERIDDPRPQDFFSVGGEVYFSAVGADVGRELWRTDGTPEHTDWLADLCPGSCSSRPRVLASDGIRLLLAVDDGLWISDGTDRGTTPLGRPCSECSGPVLFDARWTDSRFVVTVQDGADDRLELWTSDGTRSGTRRLDLPLPDFARVTQLSREGLATFGIREIGTAEVSWWITDGTEAGTRRLTTFCAACGASPLEFVALGDKILAVAFSTDAGWAPWVTDGTPEGTFRLADFNTGAFSDRPWQLNRVGDEVFGLIDGPCRYPCFFRSDGTPERTRPSPSLVPAGTETWNTTVLLGAGPTLYALRDSPDRTVPLRLYALEGPGGPQLVDQGGDIDLIGEAHGELVYVVQDGSSYRTMVTGGTPATPRLLLGLNTVSVAELGDGRFLLRTFGRVAGLFRSDLWTSDGTAGGTALIPPIRTGLTGSDPQDLGRWGDDLVFHTDGDRNRRGELWRFDGQGADRLQENTILEPTVAVGDSLYVNSYDSGIAVLRSDGGSTFLSTDYLADSLTAADDRLFFTVSDYVGQKVWVTRGDVPSTRQVVDANPSWSYSCPILCPPPPDPFPKELTWIGDRLLFAAFTGNSGEGGPPQLWSTDGTEAGSQVLRDFGRGGWPEAEAPTGLVRVGDEAYFVAVDDMSTGWGLWLTDGTAAGTRRLGDLTDPSSADQLSLLTPWSRADGEVLVFRENNAQNANLFQAKGTAIEKIADLGPGSEIYEVAAGVERVYFVGETSDAGRELWLSSGPPETTRRIDLYPGPRGSGAGSLKVFPGGVFFAADDGSGAGYEPWVLLDDEVIPRRLGDLKPGREPSNPGVGELVGDAFYFAADDGTVGRELFAVSLEDLTTPSCPTDRLCLQDGRFEVTVSWSTSSGAEGSATRVTADRDSGLMWFFDENNWETMVKVLDGCAINGRFWVFGATAADVGYQLTVTDIQTGAVRSYVNAPGQAAAAITDIEAFDGCP